eukprot:m.46467 g.46467  ORF g.46467 m.46467 type:complete len:442 (+) comp7269_c0_seq1:467-1792(+)
MEYKRRAQICNQSYPEHMDCCPSSTASSTLSSTESATSDMTTPSKNFFNTYATKSLQFPLSGLAVSTNQPTPIPSPSLTSNSNSTSTTASSSIIDQQRSSMDGKLDFVCQKCGKVYNRREHLSRHVRSHTPRSSWHKCCKCNKRFHRRDHLNYHMALHGVSPRYLCAHAACGMQYSDRKDLLEHQRVCLHFGINYAQLDKDGNLFIDERKDNCCEEGGTTPFPPHSAMQVPSISPALSPNLNLSALSSMGHHQQNLMVRLKTHRLQQQQQMLMQQEMQQEMQQQMQQQMQQSQQQSQQHRQQQPLRPISMHSGLNVTQSRRLPDPLLMMQHLPSTPSQIPVDSLSQNVQHQQSMQQYLLNMQLQLQIRNIKEMEATLSQANNLVPHGFSFQTETQPPMQNTSFQTQDQQLSTLLQSGETDWIQLYQSIVGGALKTTTTTAY